MWDSQGREPAVYGLRDAEVKIKLVHPDITGGQGAECANPVPG